MLRDTVITVSELKKSYGSFEAVKGISFEVRRGQVFSLLGHNGAGKTTTVEILEGQRNRTSGNIEVLGMDPENERSRLISRIGVLPQDFNFLELINCSEVVDFYIKSFGSADIVDEVLERVDLQDHKNSLIKSLSGGEKHKLGLALALVNDPEVLFLDEPTTGLDPVSRRSVWKVIEELRQRGKSIILTTHYLEEAQRLADYVCIMDHGVMKAGGTPDEIIEKYSKGSVLRLSLGKEDMQRFEQLGVEHRKNGNYVEIPVDSRDSFYSLIDNFRSEKIGIENLSLSRDSLEEIFIRMVGGENTDES